MSALTTMEYATLEQCETAIRRGLQTFYEIGKALATIRDARLYRADFRTFEDYCFERWGIMASRARQLIDAATVVETLQSVTDVTVLPTNEAQVRPLVRLEPEQQVEVWKEVVRTGDPTGARVEEVARRETAVKIPRTHRLSAMYRILRAALTLLEEDLGRDRKLLVFPDDAVEEAGYEVLESSLLGQLARKLIARLDA